MTVFKPLKSVTVLCCAFLFFLIASFSSHLKAQLKDTQRASEITYFFSVDPGIRVHLNKPAFPDPGKKSVVIFYALPNGNSIEMTIGSRMTDTTDWHFDIQHIGAQIRFLRSELTDVNITAVYLENSKKSWPAWRAQFDQSDDLIASIVETIKKQFDAGTEFILSGHSGGGSFITGYINAHNSIPRDISRIIYLDANYSYSDSLRHGEKLHSWLRADTTHKLCVIAYDDREIVLNGKKVVGPSGGTFRATRRMLEYFREVTDIASFQDSSIVQYEAFNKRLRMIVHTNPENTILHTVLVEKNGLIHAALFNTPAEARNYRFFGDRAYSDFIE